MEDRNVIYNHDNKNKELENNCEEAKEGNESNVEFDDCINNITIKPVVTIDIDISGLNTTISM